MSTNLGPNLTDDLLAYFSGDQLDQKVGTACVMVTQGADGFPHPCIVTPGEVVAGGPQQLRVALYQESTASRNLRSGSAATICLAEGGAAYYIKATSATTTVVAAPLQGLAVFTLTPVHVLKDAEEGAEVTSGFRFRDARGDDAVLNQWRPIVQALRDSFGR
jgi:hypothetical protein